MRRPRQLKKRSPKKRRRRSRRKWPRLAQRLLLSSSISGIVGARVVEWGRVGLYGRPPWVAWRRWLIDERVACPPTGDHKGPPTSTRPLSPLRNLGLGPGLMPIGGAWGALSLPTTF